TSVSGWNGRTQVVLLDFDTYTNVVREGIDTGTNEHVYTQEERDGIQARLEALYHGPNANPNDPSTWWFRVAFVQKGANESLADAELRARALAISANTPPGQSQSYNPDGVFAYEYFNRPRVEEDGSEQPGGVSNEVDFRNLSFGGEVLVQANGLEANQPTDSQSWIMASSTIAAHEVGHMMGLRHADAFG